MKRFWATLSLAVLITLSSLSLAAASEKGKVRQRRRIEPYVRVHVTPRKLNLGHVRQPGLYDSPHILTVHVRANVDWGGVVASATSLERAEGGTIPPERISVSVRIPPTGPYGPYVPMAPPPVAITEPMGPGVFNFKLKFQVETVLQNPAGKYRGTFIFTVGL